MGRYPTTNPYPYRSSAGMRERVLTALGVLKIATADQITALMWPNAASNKPARLALLDLETHHLTTPEGSSRRPWVDGLGEGAGLRAQRKKLWRLTPMGLIAARGVLPTGTPMGATRAGGRIAGTARGVGQSGAPHAMLVNEIVVAFARGAAYGEPGGIAQVTDWLTEVPHPIAARESVIADGVLRAPHAGLPVLMVEADRNTMPPARIAEKITRYRTYFRQRVRTPGARHEVPLWHLTYPGGTGREGYPPVAFVFAGAGPRGLHQRMAAVEELSRSCWAGHRQAAWSDDSLSHTNYQDTVPVVATTLALLAEHGPLGPAWRRFGRTRWESLPDALHNPGTNAPTPTSG
ncbi:replication-relaxation family protein [Streptomyces xiamenensis]|uniref:replication-relaxation family protein n=1 Tax=Streptomyces xiamenensis TaxID=408015 RepID=UPI0035DB8A49